MRIVIAPDKFKGSLTSGEVAESVAAGIRDVAPDVEFSIVPVADGGEGTLDAALANGFARRETPAHDPLGRPISAPYALRDGEAVVEMATASGLELVDDYDRDALAATSRGTGDLIRAALDDGARRIILAIGGSASTDGGAGMLAALGARILDDEGRDVQDGGGNLIYADRVDLSGLDPRIGETTFVLASDVDHVLLGEHGAAHVFGPQKGADAVEVERLDAGLAAFATALEAALGAPAGDAKNEPGAGAAGGVGYAALAVLEAERRPGVDVVVEFTRLPDAMRGASLAITGEGSFDHQSLGGKTPMGVVRTASALGIPTLAVCGRTLLDEQVWRDAGFIACYATSDRAPDAATSIQEAGRILREIGADIAREVLPGLGA